MSVSKNGKHKSITSIADLKPDTKNANKGSQRGRGLLEKSLRQYGAGRSVLSDKNGNLIAGNKTIDVAAELDLPVKVVQTNGEEVVVVQRTDLDIDSEAGRGLAIADNRTGEVSLEWDTDALLDIADTVDLTEFWKPDELDKLVKGWRDVPEEDYVPSIDKANELRKKWGVELGQLWQLGEHRIICGDCTDVDVVARLMDGEKAVLVHADPPYGMGKENEGIANDNLYRDKLDAFQMEWWRAVRPNITDNASVYIWGNAEDLWRLWYVGGLRDSERMTVRNEIVWAKQQAQGIGSNKLRSYASLSERCLFFMLGEQGFNNNADNYWEGWETVRLQLYEDCKSMGWTSKDIHRICGVGMYSHWFTKSQWVFITEEHYNKLQKAAANTKAFQKDYQALQKEYNKLKQEFYATYVYFDNTHDNMTDVWHYEQVTGKDRHDHATPKPVEMMERAIKSSTPDNGIVMVPFNGTAPELIACERLGRKCRAIDLEPKYIAVTLERWATYTGQQPELI
jgi:DNA modification methylase